METDKIINHEYKSVTSRILQMKAMQHHIFENMKFEVDSSLLRFDCLPRLQPTITMKEIYYRDTTSTWVWILYDKKSKQSCVLKIFKIPDFSKDEKDKLGMHYQLEVRFLRLFSYMARNHVSPHVVLPIGHTIFHSKDVQDIVGQKYKVVDNNYMVLLSECATSSLYSDILNDTLSPYHLKVLIFQVVYTIMCIQDVFPSFRHNDVHHDAHYCGTCILVRFPKKMLQSSTCRMILLYQRNGCTLVTAIITTMTCTSFLIV